MIVVDPASGKSLYVQIYEQIKEQVHSGVLTCSGRLPSIRQLSLELGVSKNTVTAAYQQLCSEGYIENRVRSGFYVAELDSFSYPEKVVGQEKVCVEPPAPKALYDFQYGQLNPADFPVNTWRRLSHQILTSSTSQNLTSYPGRQGEYRLRKAISHYLHQSRGVRCRPDQVMVGAGTQQLLSMLAVFFRGEQSIAMEDPGYDGARAVFLNNGLQVLGVALDDNGLVVHKLRGYSQNKLVYITPSHQFPMGMVMPLKRRIELLDWAQRSDGYILEDDYDGELRYSGQPIPAIQSLDSYSRVIYIGTFSKSLAPALRLSYMVLPERIVTAYTSFYERYNVTVPWLEQEVMATFMESGGWERHLRRVRLKNRKRHDCAVHTIEKHFGDRFQLHGKGAGLHMVLESGGNLQERELLYTAREAGVLLYPMKPSWYTEKYQDNMVLFGFSGLGVDAIEKGIMALRGAWGK